jgi:hypothetical protein
LHRFHIVKLRKFCISKSRSGCGFL